MMPRLLYYAEGVRKVSKVLLGQWGLAEVFAGEGLHQVGFNPGQDERDGQGGQDAPVRDGVLFWWGDVPAGRQGLNYEGRQRWLRFWQEEGEETAGLETGGPVAVWVGYWEDWKPKGDDLLRAETLEGDQVRLGDGSFWKVPRLRSIDGRVTLPVTMSLDVMTGELQERVPRRYGRLDALGWRLWVTREAEITTEGAEGTEGVPRHASSRGNNAGLETCLRQGYGRLAGGPRLSDRERIACVIEALGANHRVSRAEVALLELLEPRHALRCEEAMVGDLHEALILQAMQEEKKIGKARRLADELEAVGDGVDAGVLSDVGGGAGADGGSDER